MENENKLKASNWLAIGYLTTPTLIVLASVFLFQQESKLSYAGGTLLLSFFFTQTFILLHECGHLNYFRSRSLNHLFGNIVGFLTGIPFYTWVHMHNLHHKWTGWRDLDPTTEKTVQPGGAGIQRFIVNIAWFLFIPIFYLAYMLSNYWNILKIKRFSSKTVYHKSILAIGFYTLSYTLLFYFFASEIVHYIAPAFILSLVWKELIIMTQHTHIEIPISNGEKVRPISYSEQVQYTRSFYTFPILSRYFLFNFNLHEAHHAYPGMPAYRLHQVDVNKTKTPYYWTWFKTAKGMKGEDYIFRTSKHTGKFF